jgi:hypothetical protein
LTGIIDILSHVDGIAVGELVLIEEDNPRLAKIWIDKHLAKRF